MRLSYITEIKWKKWVCGLSIESILLSSIINLICILQSPLLWLIPLSSHAWLLLFYFSPTLICPTLGQSCYIVTIPLLYDLIPMWCSYLYCISCISPWLLLYPWNWCRFNWWGKGVGNPLQYRLLRLYTRLYLLTCEFIDERLKYSVTIRVPAYSHGRVS